MIIAPSPNAAFLASRAEPRLTPLISGGLFIIAASPAIGGENTALSKYSKALGPTRI